MAALSSRCSDSATQICETWRSNESACGCGKLGNGVVGFLKMQSVSKVKHIIACVAQSQWRESQRHSISFKTEV